MDGNKHKLSRYLNGKILLLVAGSCILSCCRQQTQDPDENSALTEVRTPVTVTSVQYGPVKEVLTLNATATFLQNSYVKSNISGFVKEVRVKLGQNVQTGQVLFVLKTREAEAIGNAVNNLNPNFRFSGTNNIKANSSGFIAELSHQP
ncbi:MAG: efflux RND transporter periplasmic adaptor subunit, partial [Bacteroidota bacterium]|nr:efflux RND transporter periplasmic adaptor subunit [Bacteroidota bacterium]